ncbi:hypothetical protein TPE_2646 [Treponema pedis str. T A4]|uniref:Uncharacterized protein n=1 Tax=Treponema pedis str. T A4 TaxID=1291379 RepID=S6A266_9SPIR|nr:hypothetical protein TPE_2646 [Treponema pedis str. T A4]
MTFFFLYGINFFIFYSKLLVYLWLKTVSVLLSGILSRCSLGVLHRRKTFFLGRLVPVFVL